MDPQIARLMANHLSQTTTTTIAIHDLDSRTSDPDPTSTIASYTTGLDGVNQPQNMLFRDVLWWSLGIAGLIVLAVRILEILWAQLRLVTSLNQPRDKQAYWRTAQWDWMPTFKTHIIYAPLWRKRHNREIRLSSALSMGTLPSRFHLAMLLLYAASNTAYMFVLQWSKQNKYALCAELRGRSGTLALVNMIPLIIFAGRNNPLIPLLKISFDTYNLFHRWLGRIVVAEVIIHTVAWAIVQVADGGWSSVRDRILDQAFIASGTVGFGALVMIFLLSLSPIRHAFYETFLNVHIILALITFICTWVHCGTASVAGGLPQLSWIMAIMSLWFADRIFRFARLAYANWSDRGYSDAVCEALEGEVTRVTIRLPRYLDVKPGTHAYLRFWGSNPWESHPFSVAWVEHKRTNTLPTSEKEDFSPPDTRKCNTELSFVIGAQTGMTRKLFSQTYASPSRTMTVRAAMEGPYAGHHSLDSYGHVVLFAGSTGITHQISYIRPLLEGYRQGLVATRRITLVWIIREYESLNWVRPFMDVILHVPARKDILRVQIYVTRPKNGDCIVSQSTTVNMFPGRPNLPSVIAREVQEQVGAMAVSVCGPGALADDVRSAVRGAQGHTVIDFVEESFTW